MDRSFLSQKSVIIAAQKFVCIRLTSYESESEKAFVAKLVNGEPANTAFAILSPDGVREVRGRGPGRGPRDLFSNADDMAKGMDAIAAKYPQKNTASVPALPITLNAKVGLAVAAGDLQPLVVIVAKDNLLKEKWEGAVAELAWNKDFSGYFTYAVANSLKEIPKLTGQTINEGIFFIEPDVFGSGGKVVQELTGDQADKQLVPAMRQIRNAHVQTPKNRRQLANMGLNEGIFYETAIPVSGKGEAADRERYKKRLDMNKK